MVRAVAAAIAALTLVLVVLKLDSIIEWSWLWIMAPIWAAGLALIVGWLAFMITIAAAIHQRDRADEAASKNASKPDDQRPS